MNKELKELMLSSVSHNTILWNIPPMSWESIDRVWAITAKQLGIEYKSPFTKR